MSQWIRQAPFQPIHLAILVVAAYFAFHFPSLWTMGLLSLLVLACLLHQSKRALGYLLPLLGLFCIFFGFQQAKWQGEAKQLPTSLTSIQLVPDTIRINGDRLSFRGHSEGRYYQAFYKLGSQEEKEYFAQLTSGLDLQVQAQLEVPTGQRNFNGFDYQNYLYTQGIYQTVQIDKIQSASPVRTFNILSAWRRSALVYSQQRFPSPMRHYVTGLLFGYLDSEFDEIGELYSSLGIIHLFALSGMQVGFFVDRFRYILLRLGLTKEEVDLAQVPFSLVYAGLTGFSISVVRSLIQKILANLGLRKLDNLALTVLVCLLLFPRFLMTAGGVLSFTYAFLLTVFDFEDLGRWKKVLVENLAISLGILPVLMVYFYSFQPLSVLLTFVFSFLFDSLLLPGLALAFICSPVIDFSWANSLFTTLENVIVWVAECGIRPVILGKPQVLLFLSLVACLMVLHDMRKRKKWLLTSLALLGLFFFVTKHPLENEVTMVDVGQGDSFFLRDMWGRTILIDVGGRVDFAPKEAWQKGSSKSNAERTLIPYLHSRGVSRIDSLVLTHTEVSV